MDRPYDTGDNRGCYNPHRKLHRSNPDSNHRRSYSYLMQAIKDKEPLNEIRYCLNNGYTLEADKKSGCSVIMFILKYNLYEDFLDINPKKISNEDLCVLLNFLVKEKGQNVNKKDNLGLTAIDYAFKYHYDVCVIQTLFKLGAKFDNMKDYINWEIINTVTRV
jgi:hypothetical protein